MLERDPKTDPCSGDVLQKGDCQRTVLRREDTGGVRFRSFYTGCCGDYAARPSTRHVSQWRQWAATAEVVKRGPDA